MRTGDEICLQKGSLAKNWGWTRLCETRVAPSHCHDIGVWQCQWNVSCGPALGHAVMYNGCQGRGSMRGEITQLCSQPTMGAGVGPQALAHSSLCSGVHAKLPVLNSLNMYTGYVLKTWWTLRVLDNSGTWPLHSHWQLLFPAACILVQPEDDRQALHWCEKNSGYTPPHTHTNGATKGKVALSLRSDHGEDGYLAQLFRP